MTDKKRDKIRRDKRIDIPTKETARVRYEKRQDDETVESFEDLVEDKIRKAMAEGEFDNLPGKGKPLDLSKDRLVPEHLRTAYHVLKNAGFVPEEIRLKKEMELIKEKIAKSDSAGEKDRLLKELADISQQYHFYMEYNKQFK
ncbi:hypothetical protein D1AOALGA4SA_3181 [Olavius algarvensis Delta 1 endosymbiont]|nr:hypothetical protein D1AOALGA4SA_3181 [Olavius algarvensis Delta 1 endosymbiont]